MPSLSLCRTVRRQDPATASGAKPSFNNRTFFVRFGAAQRSFVNRGWKVFFGLLAVICSLHALQLRCGNQGIFSTVLSCYNCHSYLKKRQSSQLRNATSSYRLLLRFQVDMFTKYADASRRPGGAGQGCAARSAADGSSCKINFSFDTPITPPLSAVQGLAVAGR